MGARNYYETLGRNEAGLLKARLTPSRPESAAAELRMVSESYQADKLPKALRTRLEKTIEWLEADVVKAIEEAIA